jgi:hypothetical protein
VTDRRSTFAAITVDKKFLSRPAGAKPEHKSRGCSVDENAANEGAISTGASRATVRVIRMDKELMIARSVWRVERTIPEKKVPPRAELTIEGATA